jgi:hypothetical protein
MEGNRKAGTKRVKLEEGGVVTGIGGWGHWNWEKGSLELRGGVTGNGGWDHRNWEKGSLELGRRGHWNWGVGSQKLGEGVTGIGKWGHCNLGVRGAVRLGKIKSKRKI